ncbi:zona pellucida sperm-binding protein 4-like [Embiotoca jacksoni]|uniref:zona pellucida sperm-binding protein 4-like n=1 Tax=Embiotoca jacksoni TaxID=100190 RepID=UPI0037040BFC
MAMKRIRCCLLAAGLLDCLAEAQYSKDPQQPKFPQYPANPPSPPVYIPLAPQIPQQTYTLLRPQWPQAPPWPQQDQPPPRPQLFQPRPRPQPPPWSQKPHTPPQTQYPHPPKESQIPEAFHTCEVAEIYKIQCGVLTISASDCQAINCCFDGHMCYYGKSVTLQCTKDGQFIVVVATDATLPKIDLESVSFLEADQRCNRVGTTSAFAIYQFPVTACGTIMMEEPGVIIYENRMFSTFEVAIGQYGAITRDNHFDLVVQCRYIGTSVEASVIEVGLIPAPPPVAAPGPLRVELQLANGQCTMNGCFEEDVAYTSFYSDVDYPVTKVLRDPVYVEVRMLERTDPNLVLTLGRCWATSGPYAHSVPQWDLLINGCPYRDDHYQTTLVPVDSSSGLIFPSHHRRFIFRMFTFVSISQANPGKTKVVVDPEGMQTLKEKVYIHCDVAVCQPSLGNNCEPRCFRNRRDIAASYQKDTRAETIVVTSNPIFIIE